MKLIASGLDNKTVIQVPYLQGAELWVSSWLSDDYLPPNLWLHFAGIILSCYHVKNTDIQRLIYTSSNETKFKFSSISAHMYLLSLYSVNLFDFN